MTLTRVRLAPFGRFAHQEVSFDPGLTVVLGPNEAGKSTLLAAVRSALLLSTRLRKTDFDQHMRRYLPLAGGDTAGVELGFQAGDGSYRLARRWGAGAGSELHAPDGAVTRDEETLKGRVAALLPATPRTVAAVLFLLQAELSTTIEALANVEAVAADLGTVIRRAVAETGGVSVERFKSTLEEELARHFRHWDEGHRRPEENRGGRWKKEVGAILKSYYEREDAQATLERARSYEAALDDLNRGIEAGAVPLGRSAAFVREHEQAWRDARERGKLEAELRAARGELERLKKDNAEWPVSEARLAALAGDIVRAEAKAGPLARERSQSEAEEKARALREQAARVERRRRGVAEARAALDALPPMDRAALGAIREAAREADRLAACVEESATVTVEARRGVGLRIAEGGAAPVSLELRDGERRSMVAPVVIEHPDFQVTVEPTGNAAEQAARAVQARAALETLLSRASCAGPAEAEERLRRRELAAAALQGAEQELAAELAGEPPARFDARVAELGPAVEARPSAAIAAEMARLEASLEALRKERDEHQGRLAELQRRYQSADQLMLAAAAAVRKEQETVEALSRSVPLPAGFDDAAAFLLRFERERAEAERLRGEQIRLLALREEKEQHAPDQSADEARDLASDADRRFATAEARGRALRRVQETAARVLGPADDEVFAGIGAEVQRLFSAMTLGRYRSVKMDQALPVGVSGSGGAGPELPRELLSVGTQDLLGLAVRMAMASCIIGDSGGFLVMDDPLVDLDPDRQAAAARAIRAFAAARQVVLFTCHPSHAELLGGTLVRLE